MTPAVPGARCGGQGGLSGLPGSCRPAFKAGGRQRVGASEAQELVVERFELRLEDGALGFFMDREVLKDRKVEQAAAGFAGPVIGALVGIDEQEADLALPELPASYLVSTIGAASDRLEYGTSRRADSVGDVPVLRMGNIQAGRLDVRELKYLSADSETAALALADGDILFNRTNSPELVGKSAVFHGREPMTFASYLIRVRLATEVADPDFANYWLNSSWGRHWAQRVRTDGVSQSNINGSKLAGMPLPLPPLEEQREIVLRANAMLEVAARMTEKVERIAATLDRVTNASMAKAFRGELVRLRPRWPRRAAETTSPLRCCSLVWRVAEPRDDQVTHLTSRSLSRLRRPSALYRHARCRHASPQSGVAATDGGRLTQCLDASRFATRFMSSYVSRRRSGASSTHARSSGSATFSSWP